MTTKKPKTTSKKVSVSPVTPGIAVGTPVSPPDFGPPQGAEEAYTDNLPAAQALSRAAVVACRADVDVIYDNLVTGVTNVLAKKATIVADLPNEDLAVLENLLSVGLALVYAGMQAKPGSAANPALHAKLAEARALRMVLLLSLEAAAAAGAIPSAKVAQVRKGRGLIDIAKDLDALAALFRAYAAPLAGKTAVTAEQVARAAQLGKELKGQVRSAGSPRRVDPAQKAASEVRDRFYTLVVQGYDRLWRVGAYLFGEADLAANVPSLLSHAGHRTVATEAAKATRVATKAAAKATKATARAAAVKPKK